ncbi:unnamed protein product [Caenorhabditis auriculariae]|uniref:Glucosylceramidase n=1 Tax=Caenorhabditis auriculariae TaxID=2777116 RepID=A0A8S1HF06_9PELO|nr:unnamed protein product [Caenorhabditis auriculariae]
MLFLKIAGFCLLFLLGAYAGKPCNLKTFQPNFSVCVCNENYCDEIDPLGSPSKGEAVIYYSSQSGKRLERSTTTGSSNKPDGFHATLDTNNKHQKMLGFGGAFTDAAGINLQKMPSALADQIINQYYSSDGIGYTFGRVPMASTDFSTRVYSYNDISNDFNLQNFNLTHEDFAYKIPYMKTAMKANNQVKFIGSPWSAPGWMKNSGNMVGGGVLKGEFNGIYYNTYAQYFVKFLTEYQKVGLPFWAVTVQNEPNTGSSTTWPWQTQYYTAEMERDFVKKLLGPALKTSAAGRNVGIIVSDDNRKNLPSWGDTIFGDSDAAKYVTGIGVHWYEDGQTPASVLTTTHNRHPDKFILATEACCGYRKDGLGEWFAAQLITDDMMTDFQNYVAGWVDWNLVLDMSGGPTWVNNNVKASIIVNPDKKEYYKAPLWHHMGHFSKFVPPGSFRISHSTDANGDLNMVAFLDPQGRRVVVVINKNDVVGQKLSVFDNGKYFTANLEPYSLATIIIP